MVNIVSNGAPGTVATYVNTGPSSARVTLGDSGACIFVLDRATTVGTMYPQTVLDSADAFKAFGLVDDSNIKGASATSQEVGGITHFNAVERRDSTSKYFRAIGCTGRYESGDFRVTGTRWTFDTHDGVSGEPMSMVDSVVLIGPPNTQISVSWGSRFE